MNKIAVIGSGGQLARAIKVRLAPHGLDAQFFGRDECDLSQTRSALETFAHKLPRECEGIIIAAAYTAVDNAESDMDTARQVNTVAPEVFAQEAANRNIPIVHVSTDYVFGGKGFTALQPTDETNPINVYGLTKRDGEDAVIKTGARSAILRTSWVFDGTGKNFMTTMLRLGETRDGLTVVDDQIGRPTYAGHLAEACLHALKGLDSHPELEGAIYHVSGTGDAVSWAGFARSIFDLAENALPQTVKVSGIPGTDFVTPASRPNWSVMDTASFEHTFNYNIPTWQDGLKEAFAEWTEHKQQS